MALLNVLLVAFGARQINIKKSEYFVHIGFIEVVMSHEINLEVEQLKELLLSVGDLLNSHGVVSYLLGHYLGVEWEHVLKLAGKIHADHSDRMHVLVSE